MGINRGKRGLTADLRTHAGQEIVRRLVPHVDVLIENYRPGMMQKWGLGYAEMRELNPRLIYVSVSAYGDARSFEGAIGNDMTVAGYSGLMAMTGEPDGAPQRLGAPFVDAAGAMEATIGTLAALRQRDKSGLGEHVSVSLIESAFATMPNYVASVLNSEAVFQRTGTGHPRFSPYRAFRCKGDQWLVVGTFHNRSWVSLCQAVGRPDLLTDTRFVENWDRVLNRTVLHDVLEGVLAQQPRDEWVEIFARHDVPCAPVLEVREALEKFDGALPGFSHPVPHQDIGSVRIIGPAFRFERNPIQPVSQAAPALGADNEVILSELGYSLEDIAQMRAEGVI
jgi:crotonobetainyl-CoA:carnitine CoA-transferase CaiB-like acyl-CoA transferase